MWEIGTKYRKKPGLSPDEIERNQRRLAKIKAAEDAAAKQAKKEEHIAALSKEEETTSQQELPSYNSLYPPPTPTFSRRTASNDRAGRFSGRAYYSRPRWQSSTSASVVQEPGWNGSNYGGLAAMWRPDITYREARDWHRRGMGEAGPVRMVPQDHPVYDMPPKERARLERIGIDPVVAAEMKKMSAESR